MAWGAAVGRGRIYKYRSELKICGSKMIIKTVLSAYMFKK
jgi:hypothetical protein